MSEGKDSPDASHAVATAEQIRVYPLWEPEKSVKAMKFPNGSGKHIDMMYPVDMDYWRKLKDFIDYEPASAIAAETGGVLASLGLHKGKPFRLTRKQK